MSTILNLKNSLTETNSILKWNFQCSTGQCFCRVGRKSLCTCWKWPHRRGNMLQKSCMPH